MEDVTKRERGGINSGNGGWGVMPHTEGGGGRERLRQTETQRKRGTERDRQIDRQTGRDRQRNRQTETQRKRGTETDRQIDRQAETDRQINRERNRQTET